MALTDKEDIITLEDGFKYYWPQFSTKGAYTAANLRAIADHLDELNREWEQQIEKEIGRKC